MVGESAREGGEVVRIVVAIAVAVSVVKKGLEGGDKVDWGLEKGGGTGGFVVVEEEEEEERKDEGWRMLAMWNVCEIFGLGDRPLFVGLSS